MVHHTALILSLTSRYFFNRSSLLDKRHLSDQFEHFSSVKMFLLRIP